ncbi:hypothetical protein [Roseibacillus ishigakijimensis]|nr:hypothetical protein [Roseibacillus ishigakijimensis]
MQCRFANLQRSLLSERAKVGRNLMLARRRGTEEGLSANVN